MAKKVIKIVLTLLIIVGFWISWFIYTSRQVPPGETVVSTLIGKIKGLGRKYAQALGDSLEGASDFAEDGAKKINEFVVDAKDNIVQEIEERTNPDATVTPEAESSSSLVEAELKRVVDGDTILVNISGEEKRVRLIGINAEESVHEDETRNNEYGRLASAYLKEKLKNTTSLWLEYDAEAQDQYGRELCYVWLSNNTGDINQMLNAYLLSEGYVYTATYKPNTKYASEFIKLQQEAKKNQKGLWVYPTFETYADQ